MSASITAWIAIGLIAVRRLGESPRLPHYLPLDVVAISEWVTVE